MSCKRIGSVDSGGRAAIAHITRRNAGCEVPASRFAQAGAPGVREILDAPTPDRALARARHLADGSGPSAFPSHEHPVLRRKIVLARDDRVRVARARSSSRPRLGRRASCRPRSSLESAYGEIREYRVHAHPPLATRRSRAREPSRTSGGGRLSSCANRFFESIYAVRGQRDASRSPSCPRARIPRSAGAAGGFFASSPAPAAHDDVRRAILAASSNVTIPHWPHFDSACPDLVPIDRAPWRRAS